MIRLIDIYKSYDNGTKALKGVNLRIESDVLFSVLL